MILRAERTTIIKIWKQGEHQCLTTLLNREVIPKACYNYALILCSVCTLYVRMSGPWYTCQLLVTYNDSFHVHICSELFLCCPELKEVLIHRNY